MDARYLGIAVVVLIGSCSTEPVVPPPPPPEVITVTETVEVRIPVKVEREPPTELLKQYNPEKLPGFVPPDHPLATSALTPEGEKRLRLLIHDLLSRDNAWRAWATEPEESDERDEQQ